MQQRLIIAKMSWKDLWYLSSINQKTQKMTHRTNPNLQINFLTIDLQMLHFKVHANRRLLVDIEFVLYEFQHETKIEVAIISWYVLLKCCFIVHYLDFPTPLSL